MSFLSGKRLLLLGFVLVLIIGIPLTVYLVQQQQQTQSQAAPTSVLSILPATQTLTAGQTAKYTVQLNPGTDNQVSFARLHITYPSDKLATTSAGIKLLGGFTSTLQGPTYSITGTTGNIVVSYSVGAQASSVISSTTSIAELEFQALDGASGTANIDFSPQTQVLSAASGDSVSQNVLATRNGATANLSGDGGGGGTVTPTLGPEPTDPVASPSPTSPVGGTTNQPPSCIGFVTDVSASGSAPFSVNFTADGEDTDGTISKVTFNFGDGPSQDVTQSGGIGSSSVSVSTLHTYNTGGIFQASAIMTDDQGAVSDSSECTQTISVEASGSAFPTATPTATITQPPTPTIEQPGANPLIVGLGGLGVFLTILGAFIFFTL